MLGTSVEKKKSRGKKFSTQKRCCMPGERGRGRDPRENALSVSRNERERRSFLPPTSSVVVVQRQGEEAPGVHFCFRIPPPFPCFPFPFLLRLGRGGGRRVACTQSASPARFYCATVYGRRRRRAEDGVEGFLKEDNLFLSLLLRNI